VAVILREIATDGETAILCKCVWFGFTGEISSVTYSGTLTHTHNGGNS